MAQQILILIFARRYKNPNAPKSCEQNPPRKMYTSYKDNAQYGYIHLIRQVTSPLGSREERGGLKNTLKPPQMLTSKV